MPIAFVDKNFVSAMQIAWESGHQDIWMYLNDCAANEGHPWWFPPELLAAHALAARVHRAEHYTVRMNPRGQEEELHVTVNEEGYLHLNAHRASR